MSWGGAERHVVDLALALHRRRHRVAVACSAGGPLAPELRRSGVPILVQGAKLVKRRFSLAYARWLREVLRALDCQIVHAHVHASEVAAAVATLGLRIPLLITEHTEAPWRGRIDTALSRWACRRAARVFAVSRRIARKLVEEDGVAAERVVYLPPVPAPGTVCPGPRQAHPPTVGFVGRLQPEKGVDLLLQAAPAILATLPGTTFLIVGDGPQRQALEEQAHRLGLGSNVRFLGYRTDVPRLLEQLSVLAVPSRSDGTPLVILEAMAAGVPVVAHSVGGIQDLVRDGIDGLLVEPDDPKALTDALSSLLLDPDRARALGEAGRRRADQFPYGDMLDAIESTYQEVVAAAARY